MQAPWFGLHLRRGNSLIGARRGVYAGRRARPRRMAETKGALAPTQLPFLARRRGAAAAGRRRAPVPAAEPGWGAVAGRQEAKKLASGVPKRRWHEASCRPEEQTSRRSEVRRRQRARASSSPGSKAPPGESSSCGSSSSSAWNSPSARSPAASTSGAPTGRTAEFAFLHRPDAGGHQGAGLRGPVRRRDTPYWRLKKIMDAWCALWFWPVESRAAGRQARGLHGTAPEVGPRGSYVDSLAARPFRIRWWSTRARCSASATSSSRRRP